MKQFYLQGKDPSLGAERVQELLAAVDTHIPQPIRDLDKPFYLPIEQVFTISGKEKILHIFYIEKNPLLGSVVVGFSSRTTNY